MKFQSPKCDASIGRDVRSCASLDSTNTLASTFSSDSANHGLVVTAEMQTAGRGQYARSWQAPPGSSILMSVLLFPPPELRRPSLLTAWAAVSVCATIRDVSGLEGTIKWPNDVLIKGKKVCGILCEAGPRHLVAGIGLNVNQTADDFQKMELPDATSLGIEIGNSLDVSKVRDTLISHLDAEYSRLNAGEITLLETDWRTRFGLIGRIVRAEQMDGGVVVGYLRELAFDGIAIETADEVLVIQPEMIRGLRGI